MRGCLVLLSICTFVLHVRAQFGALVLGGGGAKGAFQLGVLEELCKTELANQWTTVLGASIGALNAGALAQFDPQDQCTLGLAVMRDHWESIRTQDDVFVSTYGGHHCLSGFHAYSLGKSWLDTGGGCDPQPGIDAYAKRVDPKKIATSKTGLIVPTTPLNSVNGAVWFDNHSEDIFEGLIASGAISPLLPPRIIKGNAYVDGGVLHNLPLLKALQEGATTIWAINLDPFNASAAYTIQNLSSVAGSVGPAILHYYSEVVQRQMLLEQELRQACRDYPHARIFGVIPPESIGSLVGFTTAEIAQMRRYGQHVFNTIGFVDMCEYASFPRGVVEDAQTKSLQSSESSHAGASMLAVVAVGVGCVGIGIVLGVALERRRRVVPSHPLTNPLVVDC